MCGRVYIAPADPELRELVKEMNHTRLANRFKNNQKDPLQAEGEIFPSSVLPVLASNQNGAPHVFPMKWGFSGNRGLLINARAETAAQKQTFRDSWNRHRCVIPVSSYYEWEHDEKKKAGQKYMLFPEEQHIIWFAGLYRMENDIPAFVILTRPADESLIWMHDRMPVMLSKPVADQWIRPDAHPDLIIKKSLTRIRWEKTE